MLRNMNAERGMNILINIRVQIVKFLIHQNHLVYSSYSGSKPRNLNILTLLLPIVSINVIVTTNGSTFYHYKQGICLISLSAFFHFLLARKVHQVCSKQTCNMKETTALKSAFGHEILSSFFELGIC